MTCATYLTTSNLTTFKPFLQEWDSQALARFLASTMDAMEAVDFVAGEDEEMGDHFLDVAGLPYKSALELKSPSPALQDDLNLFVLE